jgi:t-SNARE complex subunit (syntaxin)
MVFLKRIRELERRVDELTQLLNSKSALINELSDVVQNLADGVESPASQEKRREMWDRGMDNILSYSPFKEGK